MGNKMNDLAGTTALVTGGTSGIGRAVALELACRSANVAIVGRSRAKGQAVAEKAQASGAASFEFVQADLSEVAQVRRVAEEFLMSHDRLNILVHSAGGHFLRPELTADGIEMNFATNYLSKFLLTNLLLGRLIASTPARVVVVGSPVVNPKRWMHLEGARKRPAVPLQAMLTSGLATAVWTVEQARRLEGTGVSVNNVNPVIVRTGITRTWHPAVRVLDGLVQRLVGVSPKEGAQAPVYLITSPDVTGVSGQFFKKTKPVNVSPETFDRELAARLWALSEQLTGLTFPDGQPRSSRSRNATL